MLKRYLKSFGIPAFVAVVLISMVVLGGSSQPGQDSHLWIQFVSICLGGLFVLSALKADWTASMSGFGALLLAIMIWTALQLIPLPPELWAGLPGRSIIVQGWTLIGAQGLPPFPISFDPASTRAAILGFAPPTAIALLLIGLGWRRSLRPLAWIIPVIGASSVMLGLVQIAIGSPLLYFHEVTNNGFSVGFFANVNHQATLCLICLPLSAALGAKHRQNWQGGDSDVGLALVIGGLFTLNLVGVLMAGSVGGYVILVPVLILSALLFRVRGKRSISSRALTPALLLGTIGISAALVFSSPALDRLGVTSLDDTELSRRGIWGVSSEIAEEHVGVGTGLGTFVYVYRQYEDPTVVNTRFVNNAHNDYLQLAIELGLPGLIIIGVALALFLFCFIRTWTNRSDRDHRFRKAASISLLAVILHSAVDYPLRTPAIAVLSAACLVIMLMPSQTPKRSNSKTAPEDRSGHISL